MIKFALAGNPNCGKTTLFNSLTGSTAHVGNWPGVTVDKKEGIYKKCPEPISIVDLPGIYSLSPYTPEEVVSRNFILDEKPDCVINIIDATNLERNLYLTTQIMEIDVPMVIALNMMDEVEKAGDKIDAATLEKKIGLPVVPISALKFSGLDELMQKAYAESKLHREGFSVLEDSELMHLIGDCKIALEGQGVANSLFHAIKLVEMDEIEVKAHVSSAKMVEEFKKTFKNDTFGCDFEAMVADSRYKYISKNYSSVLTKNKKHDKFQLSRSDRMDSVLTHKLWGIPIFIVIMFLVFHFTFSEDLFFLGAMGAFDGKATEVSEALCYDEDGDKVYAEDVGSYASDAKFYYDAGGKYEVELSESADGYKASFTKELDKVCAGISINTFFGYEDGVYSPGIILYNAVSVLTDIMGAAVSDGLASAPQWVSGLVCDGILGGLFTILSFLPQILLLFLFFSILEDSGYMARIAFILDRLFRKFGLSGRAFMPMIMGFGCSVPAMINTRTLADQNERIATIRVIPFFSCGAKLPILTAIAGAIVQQFGVGNADLITYGMYLLGIVVAILSVLLMHNTSLKGDVPPFIMELPAYHAPQFKNLMLHLWDKAKHFLQKAFTVILASTIIIWFVSHFSWFWEYLPDNAMSHSILAGLGGIIQPLFTPLGFGSQLGTWGWIFIVAAITGLVAKENVIATFGTLSACITSGIIAEGALEGVDSVVQMIAVTGISVPALIAFIAFNMMTIPCTATVATAKAELPSKQSFTNTLLFWVAASYLVAAMIYVIGSWWWTAFIFAAVIAAAVTVIVLNNTGKINLKKLAQRFKIKKRNR